jgi:hypothetical protein
MHRFSTHGCAAALALGAALLFTPPARAQLGGNDPALSAVDASCTMDLGSQASQGCLLLNVPSGKRLVIDNLSATCTIWATGLIAPDIRTIFVTSSLLPGGQTRETQLPMRKQASAYSNGTARADWQGMSPVRVYSDTLVQARATRVAGQVGQVANCEVNLQGHLVTLLQ